MQAALLKCCSLVSAMHWVIITVFPLHLSYSSLLVPLDPCDASTSVFSSDNHRLPFSPLFLSLLFLSLQAPWNPYIYMSSPPWSLDRVKHSLEINGPRAMQRSHQSHELALAENRDRGLTAVWKSDENGRVCTACDVCSGNIIKHLQFIYFFQILKSQIDHAFHSFYR